MKSLVINTSNNSASINRVLAKYVAGELTGEVDFLDLTELSVPMYGIDEEKANGVPADISGLVDRIAAVDRVVVASPEHNGLPSAFFKNILDWLSRTGVKYMEGKALLLLSTSPGGGAGRGNLNHVSKIMGYAGVQSEARFSLPSFGDNFDNGVTDEALSKELSAAIAG